MFTTLNSPPSRDHSSVSTVSDCNNSTSAGHGGLAEVFRTRSEGGAERLIYTNHVLGILIDVAVDQSR